MQADLKQGGIGNKERCGTCAYHDDFSWVCFNPDSENRADFTNPRHGCNCWTSMEGDTCEKKI